MPAGLIRHPQLKDEYFRHYRRVMYLVQSHLLELSRLPCQHADWLQLEYVEDFTGLAPVNRRAHSVYSRGIHDRHRYKLEVA